MDGCQIRSGLGIVRFEAQSGCEFTGGGIELAGFAQRHPKIEMGPGIIRASRDCQLIMADGLI